MAQLRSTAIAKTRPRAEWSGTYFNEQNWASAFRSYSPHNFGLMAAQTFATQLGQNVVNKPLLYLTQGMGNTYELPAGHHNYTWRVATDGNPRARIMEVDSNLPTQPGKGGTSFRICLSRGDYHQPVVLKTESRTAPMLKIQGYPERESANKFWYTVTLQTGDPTAYIAATDIARGKTVIDATTAVADSMNEFYGGIETGSHYDLQGHIGYFARKIEINDKAIRLEKSAREQGKSPGKLFSMDGKSYDSVVGTGYMIVQKDRNGKVTTEALKAGTFIPNALAVLEERLAWDKEWNMVFGKSEVSRESGKQMTVGAGWYEIVRDGFYSEHNGSVTLSDFTDQLESQYFNAVDIPNRKVYVKTGQEGMKIASRLIEAEAGISPFVFDSSYFITDASKQQGVNAKELAFGAQFTEFRSYNGVTLCFVHDPSKDNPKFYPELDEATGKPLESSSFDVFDLGESDAAPGGSKSNLAYVWEPDYEENFVISNVYDPIAGSVKDGSTVANLSKEAGFYRASSGKLEVWDTTRIMRIARV